MWVVLAFVLGVLVVLLVIRRRRFSRADYYRIAPVFGAVGGMQGGDRVDLVSEIALANSLEELLALAEKRRFGRFSKLESIIFFYKIGTYELNQEQWVVVYDAAQPGSILEKLAADKI